MSPHSTEDRRLAQAKTELVVELTHIAAGLSLVAAWGLLVAGLLKKRAGGGTPNG